MQSLASISFVRRGELQNRASVTPKELRHSRCWMLLVAR